MGWSGMECGLGREDRNGLSQEKDGHLTQRRTRAGVGEGSQGSGCTVVPSAPALACPENWPLLTRTDPSLPRLTYMTLSRILSQP